MFRNRLYYRVKPILPPALRLAVRRWFAVRKREKVGSVWPILPGSERPPVGWTGWPDGKQFALVLTHDVEGSRGLERCRELMTAEAALGFRSSFNFIPEGRDYTVPSQLREELSCKGFEVGVHDLHHDGNLYDSHRFFSAKASRINDYLKEWGAVGFRSGFMLRKLDWLHNLHVGYDASTFDTDPFEPQPDGANTIFPFWVPRPARKPDVGPSMNVGGSPESSILNPPISPLASHSEGYVELPYTLPQDSTLFRLLGETSPRIWLDKLDWIAKHGGMALINVHPDYIRFSSDPATSRTYPVSFYTDLLTYVRQKYGNCFWQPLPREVASFVARSKPQPPRKPRRICMVAYSHFLSDARVTRYAEALAERGDHVDVVALKRSPDLPREEKIGKVNLIRLQARFGKNEKSPVSFLLPVLRFLSSSSLWITRQHLKNRYDLLHIHNIPDFLVFAGWFPKLTGTKVILDIHDIVPEFYGSKFAVSDRSMIIRTLKWVEIASARFADHVIMSNHLWRDKYTARTGTGGRCSVFINNVDSGIFQPRTRTRNDPRQIIIFPGGLQWHQGLDIAIRAFKRVRTELPRAEFHIYGDGNMKEKLIAQAAELGMNGSVKFFNPLPVREIAEIMANANLGVVPKRADSFGNEAYSTKIMEFMSLGVPVVVSSTKIDRFYFDDSVVRFFESGNHDALADAIIEVLSDDTLRSGMARRASQYAIRNSWERRKGDYLKLVDGLIGGTPCDGSTTFDDIMKPEVTPALEPVQRSESKSSAAVPAGRE